MKKFLAKVEFILFDNSLDSKLNAEIKQNTDKYLFMLIIVFILP